MNTNSAFTKENQNMPVEQLMVLLNETEKMG